MAKDTEHLLCAMTISIDELEELCRKAGHDAALAVCNTPGLNEAARVYAMCRVIEVMMEHVQHSNRTNVLKAELLGEIEDLQGRVKWWGGTWFVPVTEPCWVCGTDEATGCEPRFLYVVCEEHSKVAPNVVREGPFRPREP